MLNIQIENLPKLRMSNSQARSQISNILSARHKTKASFDSIFDKSEQVSTPNRVRKKDQLSILDESLDAKEISMRNNTNQDLHEEFCTYKEHLELLAVYIKSSNPILAFSLNRGISGCFKSVTSYEKLLKALQSKPVPQVQEKKTVRDSQVQTSPEEKEDDWKAIHKKDLKIFKHLEKKLEEINITKVSQKLKDLHKSLKKAVSEVPGLSKFPELSTFNVKDTISNLEKHVRSLQTEVSHELVKRKLASLPIPVSTQTEVPLIDPLRYFVLEKMLVEKEQEIFEYKKKIEIFQMEKKNLLEKYETSQSCLNQCEKLLYKAREKEAKFDRLKEEKELEKEKFEKKLLARKEKIKEIKNNSQNFLQSMEKQRIQVMKMAKEFKESVVKGKIAEAQLKEIRTAWQEQFGENFKFSAINMKEIVASVQSNMQQDYQEVLNQLQNSYIPTEDLKNSTIFPKSPGKNSENPDFLASNQDPNLTFKQSPQTTSSKSKKSLNRLSTQSFLKSPQERLRKVSIDLTKKSEEKGKSSSPQKFSSILMKNEKGELIFSENSQEGLNNFEFFQDSFSKNSFKQSFLSRIEKNQSGNKNFRENEKHSGQVSTQFTEESSNGSFYRRGKQESEDFYENFKENPEQLFEILMKKAENGEKLSNIQEKFLQFYQGSNLKSLIREDPDEYLKNTFSLFDPRDELHARILKEFPTIAGIPKRLQFELFTLMMEHEKMMCRGECKHLNKVNQLKYRSKGVPYPIRKKTVEF